MVDERPVNSNEENEDHRSEAEKYQDRQWAETRRLIAEFAANIERQMAETDRQMAETDRKIAETDRQMAETDQQMAETDKRIEQMIESEEKAWAEVRSNLEELGKQIGGVSNKFGGFTEGLAMPSIRKILDEKFDADFQPAMSDQDSRRDVDHLLDAWGVARNGAKIVYLIEVKSKFRIKHFTQVWRQVAAFRKLAPEYADHLVYPMLAVVDIPEMERQKVWDEGIFLIDIADGVFTLAEKPAGFRPTGSHGIDKADRGTQFLRMVPGGLTDGKRSQH